MNPAQGRSLTEDLAEVSPDSTCPVAQHCNRADTHIQVHAQHMTRTQTHTHTHTMAFAAAASQLRKHYNQPTAAACATYSTWTATHTTHKRASSIAEATLGISLAMPTWHNAVLCCAVTPAFKRGVVPTATLPPLPRPTCNCCCPSLQPHPPRLEPCPCICAHSKHTHMQTRRCHWPPPSALPPFTPGC
jgi:hypothetical protein